MKSHLYTESTKFLEKNLNASPLDAYKAGFNKATDIAQTEIDRLICLQSSQLLRSCLEALKLMCDVYISKEKTLEEELSILEKAQTVIAKVEG